MRTNTYEMFRMLHNLEYQELKQAVNDFGGYVHFGYGDDCEDDYDGRGLTHTDYPVVTANVSKWECGPEDVYIRSCVIGECGRLIIYAEQKESFDGEFELDYHDIEFGHISFITDLVPDKDKERTEIKQNLIMETAVFMACDIFDKMYNPEKGMGVFEVCNEIISLAKKFEDTRTWKVSDDDYDEGRYLDELDAFEKEYLKSLS